MILQPTNIIPSTLSGESVVNPSDFNVSWQVNGDSPLVGYQIDIYPNTGDYATDKYALSIDNDLFLDNPFYGKDELGNYINYDIETQANIGMNKQYRMKILQIYKKQTYYQIIPIPYTGATVDISVYYSTDSINKACIKVKSNSPVQIDGTAKFSLPNDSNVYVVTIDTSYNNNLHGSDYIGYFVSPVSVYPSDYSGTTDWNFGGLSLAIIDDDNALGFTEQYSESVFYTRIKPNVKIKYDGTELSATGYTTIPSYTAEFVGEYSDPINQPLDWVQWDLGYEEYDGAEIKIINTTGQINTNVLKYTADGLIKGNYYGIRLTVKTVYGDIITSNWKKLDADYFAPSDTGKIVVDCKPDSAEILTPVSRDIPASAYEDYSISASNSLILPTTGSYVEWNKVNEKQLEFNENWDMKCKMDFQNNLPFVCVSQDSLEETEKIIAANGTYVISVDYPPGTLRAYTVNTDNTLTLYASTNIGGADAVCTFINSATPLIYVQTTENGYIYSITSNSLTEVQRFLKPEDAMAYIIHSVHTHKDGVFSHVDIVRVEGDEEIIYNIHKTDTANEYAQDIVYNATSNNTNIKKIVASQTENVLYMSYNILVNNTMYSKISSFEFIGDNIYKMATVVSMVPTSGSASLIFDVIFTGGDISAVVYALLLPNEVWRFEYAVVDQFLSVIKEGKFTSISRTIFREPTALPIIECVFDDMLYFDHRFCIFNTDILEFETLFYLDYGADMLSGLSHKFIKFSNSCVYMSMLWEGIRYYNYRLDISPTTENGYVAINKVQTSYAQLRVGWKNGDRIGTFQIETDEGNINYRQYNIPLIYSIDGSLHLTYEIRRDEALFSFAPSDDMYASVYNLSFTVELNNNFRNSTIRMQGKQLVDYLYIETRDAEIEIPSSYPVPVPSYSAFSKFYANFEDDEDPLQAGTNINTKYKTIILRKEENEKVYSTIFCKNPANIRDYAVKSGEKYNYFVLFDFYEDETFSISTSDTIFCKKFPFYTLIEAKKENNKYYEVVNVWNFGNNIETSGISNNNSPNWLENFTKYPLRQKNSQSPKSGTLQALLSNVDKNGDYSDSAEQMEKLFDISLSNNTFFLRDMKGNLYMVGIDGAITQTIENRTLKKEVTISVPWREVGDADGVSIIQVED